MLGHSLLRAAARPFTRCRLRIDVHDLAGQRRRQRQRVTEGTAMAPWNGPNYRLQFITATLRYSRASCELYDTV